ncbi:MAG: hypothetical protein Q9227_008944 [Pyrenula ochraceoflavens]
MELAADADDFPRLVCQCLVRSRGPAALECWRWLSRWYRDIWIDHSPETANQTAASPIEALPERAIFAVAAYLGDLDMIRSYGPLSDTRSWPYDKPTNPSFSYIFGCPLKLAALQGHIGRGCLERSSPRPNDLLMLKKVLPSTTPLTKGKKTHSSLHQYLQESVTEGSLATVAYLFHSFPMLGNEQPTANLRHSGQDPVELTDIDYGPYLGPLGRQGQPVERHRADFDLPFIPCHIPRGTSYMYTGQNDPHGREASPPPPMPPPPIKAPRPDLVQFAAQHNRPEILVYLLTHDSSASVESPSQPCALTLAAYRGYTRIMQILIDHGASVYGSKGESLIIVAKRGQTEAVSVLLERGLMFTKRESRRRGQ